MQSSSWSYGVKILEEMQVKNNNNKKIRSSCVLILINLPNVVFVYFVDKPFVNLRCFFRNTSQILFTIAYFPVPVIFARYSISGILATYIYYFRFLFSIPYQKYQCVIKISWYCIIWASFGVRNFSIEMYLSTHIYAKETITQVLETTF